MSRFLCRLGVSAVALVVMAAHAEARPVNLDRTIHVSPVPGNPVASGDRLLAALAGIAGAAADNTWLIKIEPGWFDLNGRSLVLKPYVDVEGSGREMTVIFSTVESTATVKGADFMELRELTVRNHAAVHALALSNSAVLFRAARVACWARGRESAVGIFNSVPGGGGSFEDVAAVAHVTEVATGILATNGVFRRVHATGVGTRFAWGFFTQASMVGEIEDLTARAIGDSYAAAIRNEAGRPLLRNIRAVGQGTTISEGIVNGAGSDATIHNAVIDVTGGADSARGIRNEFGSPQISDVSMVVNGTASAFGVTSLLGGAPILRNLTVRVSAGGNGVGIHSDATQVTVESSTILSDGLALRNHFGSAATSIRVGASRLGGGVDAGLGTLRCAASYDGTFMPLGANCLP